MKDFITTERFEESFQKLPIHIREKFYENCPSYFQIFDIHPFILKKLEGVKIFGKEELITSIDLLFV